MNRRFLFFQKPLDRSIEYATYSGVSTLSTAGVAREVGIDRVTLERWISSGKVKMPKLIQIGNRAFRNWTDRNVEKVRKYKQENYRKGRGRKPKPKR